MKRIFFFSSFFRLLGLFLFFAGGPRIFAASCTSGSWISIHAIQTSSPCTGSTVTTTGIVTAVLSDGFYIENSDSASKDTYNESWDSNTCTSEGIFVYTPTATASTLVALKEHVEVTGMVAVSNSGPEPGTEIYISAPVLGVNVVSLSTGNSLPSAVSSATITTALSGSCSAYAAYSFGQWLPFQGMRVNVPSSSTLLVTAGTGGTLTPSTQTASSSGQFWGTITTTTRPFRKVGIDVLDPAYIANESALSGVTAWDANPALMLIDTTALGGTALETSAGTEYTGSSNLVGIVDYHISALGYTGLLLTSDAVSALSTATSGNTPTAATARSTGQSTFATLDLDSLQESESKRVTKLAEAIVRYMHAPDVIAVQGATATALTNLVSAVTAASGPSYTLSTLSTTASGCTTCYYNAFLVNDAQFDGAPTAAQALASATYTTSASTTATLFDRSPLVLTARIPRSGISDYIVYLVNASLMDRAALAVTATSAAARTQRAQQAEQLATGVLEPLESSAAHVALLGGLNSFEFSDGYVDTLGILSGSEAASGTVWLYDSTVNSTVLVNATTAATNLSLSKTNPATSRYTYVENGSAEQPDHILYTSAMSSLVAMDYARIGADFPVSDSYDTSTVARASSHDAVIGYLTVPYPTKTTVTGSPNASSYGEEVTFTATVVVTDDDGTVSTSAPTPDSGTVTFSSAGTTLCTATVSSGTARCTSSALPVGSDTVTASYGGSESGLGDQSSSGAYAQTVAKDATTLTLSPGIASVYYGHSTTVTATAASTYGDTPTGTVTFFVDGASAGSSTLSSGAASYASATTLSVGTHTITATYAGDDTHVVASGSSSVTVLTTDATTSTLACSPTTAQVGATVSCTDTITASTGTVAGTITYYDGTTALGTATVVSGTASFTLSSLAIGAHAISAVFAESDPYLASTSNSVTVKILSSFTLTATPTTRTLYTGEATTYTLTATPGTDFTYDIALSCSGLPANTTCVFSPATISGGTGSTTLTLQTTAPAQSTSSSAARLLGGGSAMLAGLFCVLAPLRWRKKAAWLVLFCVALSLGALSGCGGSSSLSGGTPAGSYTVTVTGTSTVSSVTITDATTVTLNVKSLF